MELPIWIAACYLSAEVQGERTLANARCPGHRNGRPFNSVLMSEPPLTFSEFRLAPDQGTHLRRQSRAP